MGEMQSPELIAVDQLNRIEAKLDTLLAHAGGHAIGADAELIEAVAAAFGGREFTTHELVGRGSWDDNPARRLAACLRGQRVRALGIRLSKLVGRPTVAGLMLQQTDELRGCVVWRVLLGQD